MSNRFLRKVLCICAGFISASADAASLEDLIRQGLASYPTILARQSAKDAAQTDLTTAKLKFLPTPSFSTQRQTIAYSGQPTNREPATNISISQPLFLDGGIIAGYNKADARLSAADYGLLETREEVSKRVINSYTQWLVAWMKIQALEDSVRLHEKLLAMIVRRYENGVASGADRDLGQSRLQQAQAELETQRSLESSALVSLSQLVGEPIGRQDLVGYVAKPLKPPRRTDGIAHALRQSVTVQRYTYEAEAAEQEAKEIRAQALPQLAFQAQRQIGNAYVPGAQGFDMYGLVVTYSPGGGFSSITGASAAFDRAKGARHQIETAKRELTDRLNADYNEYEFSQLKKESLQRAVDLSGDISASYDRQFFVGRKSWMDLMNSVRERAQTRVQLADAEGGIIGSSRRLMVYIDGTQPFDMPHEQDLKK
ncbi:TolC family protein [Fluviibacter phosphoraccumulans]|uniref:TolC family protein n=1 Tax=Fluviibacter phosphoraccumulans TaxID=1751046 RepID=UPI00138964E1|nr:TolC family protein [Fluviibacter phosphoraccumulans]